MDAGGYGHRVGCRPTAHLPRRVQRWRRTARSSGGREGQGFRQRNGDSRQQSSNAAFWWTWLFEIDARRALCARGPLWRVGWRNTANSAEHHRQLAGRPPTARQAGGPRMIEVDEKFEVAAPPVTVWQLLSDPQAVVGCVPGASIVSVNDDGSLETALTVKFGPIGVSFQAHAELELDEPAMQGRLTARGRDKQGGARFQ